MIILDLDLVVFADFRTHHQHKLFAHRLLTAFVLFITLKKNTFFAHFLSTLSLFHF